jgi:phospholipase/carboxylesterase
LPEEKFIKSIHMKKLIILFSLILIAGVIYWWRMPPTVQGTSSDHEFEYIIRQSGEGDPSEPLPMVIALHGHGDTPENFFDTLLKRFNEPARFILVRGPLDYPGARLGGRAWPTDSEGLREHGDALSDAILVLEDKYPTTGKPIVLGFSSGAIIAYYLAAFHADTFSYIFPLAGRLPGIKPTSSMTSFHEGAAVIAFHARNDQVIGFNNGKSAVRALIKIGLDAELITIDGGHPGIFRSGNKLLIEHLSDAIYDITQ